jgi:hypothetical protein
MTWDLVSLTRDRFDVAVLESDFLFLNLHDRGAAGFGLLHEA